MGSDGVWERRSLGEIAPSVADQIKPRDSEESEFHYLGLDAIPSGGWLEPALNLVKGAQIRSTCIQFDGRHVLYAKLRPYLNKVVVPKRGGIASTEFVPLLPDQSMITRQFLAWYLRSPQFVAYAVRNSTGARMPRIRMPALWEAEIPLPPLDEQRRIVARIEAVLERIEEARRLRLSTQEDSERLVSAALAKSFESLRNNNHPVEQFGDLASEVRNGMSKRVWVEPPQGVASLNIGNVTQLDFSIGSCRRIRFDLERHFEYIVQPRDVLICNVNGSPRLVGAVAVYPGASEPVVIDHNITRARMRATAMPEFVAYHLREPATRVEIEARFATSSGQAYLPQRKLATVPVIVPPLSEQRRIVEYLDGVQAQVDELKRLQTASAAELERLEGAVLARAFRVEL